MDNTYVWDHVLQQRHKELMCAAKAERMLREIRANQQKEQARKSSVTGKRSWPRPLLSVKFVKHFLSF